MLLSIIIPVHNEEKYIEETIRKVASLSLPGYEKEIIVINDGSSDNSRMIIERLQKEVNLKLICHPQNKGKGAAIRTGMENVNGDYIIIQDADNEYDPENYKLLLESIDIDHPVIFGNRGIKSWPERGFHYILGAKLLTWTFNLLYQSKIKDLYTGYKVFSQEALRDIILESNGFEFEAEISCKLAKKGIKIKEAAIVNYFPRSLKQGKHIRARDAFKGFLTIIRYRW